MAPGYQMTAGEVIQDDIKPGLRYQFFGEGIFTQEGQAWKQSREMLRRRYTRIQARDLETFILDLYPEFHDRHGITNLPFLVQLIQARCP
ncbi:hypothetical protein FOPE_02166 [Fonsecaea pedrosoi]|nr:hypothetical protein FOPE_02166 [Fonsecaea pedrosoi]